MSHRPAEWDDAALVQWFRLSFDDAELVARAVESWNATGEGVVIEQSGAFYLFVGAHVVMFHVVDDVMHVAQVRRA